MYRVRHLMLVEQLVLGRVQAHSLGFDVLVEASLLLLLSLDHVESLVEFGQVRVSVELNFRGRSSQHTFQILTYYSKVTNAIAKSSSCEMLE